MKKVLMAVFGCMLAMHTVQAQSKVFKEVSDEISSQMKIITQDDALVGYLVFTQLEKASEDSFSYKISIMDENLNDIGKVEFREENISLQGVSFEQDMLCLAYFKSNIIGKEFKNLKEYKKSISDARHNIMMQFMNLEGKVLKTQLLDLSIKLKEANFSPTMASSKGRVFARLKNSVQLKNIPQKGFVCFYGDDDNNKLIAYAASGDVLWRKDISNASGFGLLTTSTNLYLLSKQNNDDQYEGGYALQAFSIADSIAYKKNDLKDKNGNGLKVLTFQNDPLTGKPYLAGHIIDPEKGEYYLTTRSLSKGTYNGVFTIDVTGPEKTDLKAVYSYWGDGSLSPTISKRGKYEDLHAYARYSRTVKDFQGDTYFVGSTFIKRPKIGTIISSAVLMPVGLFGLLPLASGFSKSKFKDAILLKQNAAGKLTVDNTISCNNSKFFRSGALMSQYDDRSFYNVVNPVTKTNYLIIDDVKDIVIYNMNQKKVARTVPHKDGKIITNIYPAKEGHIMVSEYNKKEKYSKYSIESL